MIGVGSFVAAWAFAQVDDAHRARWWGRVSTIADVGIYAGYSIAFHNVPGAGSLYGVFVLLMGPVRYGLRGVPATVVPVGLIAALWPQLDLTGKSIDGATIVALC